MDKKFIIWAIIFILVPVVYADILEIAEYEQKEYQNYSLQVLYIGNNKVKFKLNDMVSETLEERDTYRFEEGSYIYVREILENEALEGPDIVSFRLWLAKSPITTDPEMIQNITEKEIPSIVPHENIIEINLTEPIKNITEEITSIEKSSFLERVITWIKNLFKK